MVRTCPLLCWGSAASRGSDGRFIYVAWGLMRGRHAAHGMDAHSLGSKLLDAATCDAMLSLSHGTQKVPALVALSSGNQITGKG